MKLSLACLLAFAAYLAMVYPDPEPVPWEVRVCRGHAGLQKVITSETGHKTAVCRDGDRHGLIPSEMEILHGPAAELQ